jgi:hypothetical protein
VVVLSPPKHEHVVVMWKHRCICKKHNIKFHLECTNCQCDFKSSHVNNVVYFKYKERFEQWDHSCENHSSQT